MKPSKLVCILFMSCPLWAAADDSVQALWLKVSTLIQNVEIALYCDELAADSITFNYAGIAAESDIGRTLDKIFKPHSSYRPFAKGLMFDDQRGVSFDFDGGLQYLPKGTLTVSVKNGNSIATKELDFSRWNAGETKWVYFPDITWDPTEWDAQFRFDDTTETRSYHWVRQQ